MNIPDQWIFEVGIGVVTILGSAIITVLLFLYKEIRQSNKLTEALKDEIVNINTRMLFCKYCPHPAGDKPNGKVDIE